MLVSKNMTSCYVINAIMLSLLVSTAPVVDSNNTDRVEIYDDSLSTDCSCGPHSQKCVFQNNTKVCECDYKYRQEGETCEAYCERDIQCDNGGLCVNQSCQCLNGTSGDFCTTVEECDGIKGPLMCGDPEITLCWYNKETQKPYCLCRTYEYLYYAPNRTCIECDCGEYGTCSLVDGKKTCNCTEDTSVRPVRDYWGGAKDTCIECWCGYNSDGCSFDGFYNKVCSCTNGTVQKQDVLGGTCRECNCGPNGDCYYSGWEKYCNCSQGYVSFETASGPYCKACDCGKNGECCLENEKQRCKCNSGYALRNNTCTACQCYADDETVNCTFTNKIQTCLCPEGYETGKFFCTDIDECLNGNNSCPPTTDCVNTKGSYVCICKEGYARKSTGNPKVFGCDDIDECKYDAFCPPTHTVCTNFPGTYSCVCENGYVTEHPKLTPVVAGCPKEATKKLSGWAISLITVGVVICAGAMVKVAVILRRKYINRRNRRASTSFHQMR